MKKRKIASVVIIGIAVFFSVMLYFGAEQDRIEKQEEKDKQFRLEYEYTNRVVPCYTMLNEGVSFEEHMQCVESTSADFDELGSFRMEIIKMNLCTKVENQSLRDMCEDTWVGPSF